MVTVITNVHMEVLAAVEPKRPKVGGKEDIQWEMGYCENKIFNLTLKASKHEIMDKMGQTSMVLFFNMQGRTLQKS